MPPLLSFSEPLVEEKDSKETYFIPCSSVYFMISNFSNLSLKLTNSNSVNLPI